MKLLNSRRRISLAIAFLLAVLLFVGKCHGQPKAMQYQVEMWCQHGECKSNSGVIAITDKEVFIKLKGHPVERYEIHSIFKIKDAQYFTFKHEFYTGFFVVYSTRSAFLDVNVFGEGYYSERFILKTNE
jgi:hypothetical protein